MRRAVCVLVVLAWGAGASDIEIRLNKSFVEKYKNRATIEDTCVIDKAHKAPNPPAKDGDVHIASRCKEAALAGVAEIMNAKGAMEAFDFVKATEGSDTEVKVTGVWRLWCEHGGTGIRHIQGDPLEKFTTTNPDHVYEVHPVIQMGPHDVRGSLKTIDGFQEKDAREAFQAYERTRFQIRPQGSTITMRTVMAGYNYTKFKIKLTEDPHPIEDGFQAMSSVFEADADTSDNNESEILVRRRRMVFVKGTGPGDAVAGKHAGDTMVVLGVPRIDLSLVSWRAKKGGEARDWDLPYEMVIVGVYE